MNRIQCSNKHWVDKDALLGSYETNKPIYYPNNTFKCFACQSILENYNNRNAPVGSRFDATALTNLFANEFSVSMPHQPNYLELNGASCETQPFLKEVPLTDIEGKFVNHLFKNNDFKGSTEKQNYEIAHIQKVINPPLHCEFAACMTGQDKCHWTFRGTRKYGPESKICLLPTGQQCTQAGQCGENTLYFSDVAEYSHSYSNGYQVDHNVVYSMAIYMICPKNVVTPPYVLRMIQLMAGITTRALTRVRMWITL